MNIICVEVEATREAFFARPSARVRIDCYRDLDTGKVWIQGAEGKWDFNDGTESYFAGHTDAVLLGEIEQHQCREDRVIVEYS